MFQGANLRVIILIMLMAIILAVTAALVFIFMSNRADFPEGTYETVVEGELILVDSDPDKLVRIVSTQAIIAEPDIPEGGQGGEGNVTVITETVIPITNTPLPPTPIPPEAVQPIATPPPVAVQPIASPPVAIVPPIAILPTPLPSANQVIFVNYQVVQGDTLYSISNSYNTTIALMARYGIDANDLVPGRVIRLPVANPAFCPTSFPYVVDEGNTLSSIARKCGTTVAALIQLNGFTPNNYSLDVTQVICVPNPP
jgi:LysM repeat protein